MRIPTGDYRGLPAGHSHSWWRCRAASLRGTAVGAFNFVAGGALLLASIIAGALFTVPAMMGLLLPRQNCGGDAMT